MFLRNASITLAYIYNVYNWELGISPKTPSGGHASLGMMQRSYRLI